MNIKSSTPRVVYKCKLQEEDSNETREISVIGLFRTESDARDALWEEMMRQTGEDTSLTSLMNNWEVKRPHIYFANSPWNDSEDLLEELRSWSEISTVRLEKPFEGAYGPTKYYIKFSEGCKEDGKEKISDYYDGLTFESKGGRRGIIYKSVKLYFDSNS